MFILYAMYATIAAHALVKCWCCMLLLHKVLLHECYCALIIMCYVNHLPAVSAPTIQLLLGHSH